MPLLQVTLIEGRAAETKRALIRELTDAVVRVLDVPAPAVRVLLDERPAAHWGVGGVPKSDDPPAASPTTNDRSDA